MGVYPAQTPGKYYASITVDRETIYLGTYSTAEAAAAAYDTHAILYHGEFARPNLTRVV
jgi:hypothetical protein